MVRNIPRPSGREGVARYAPTEEGEWRFFMSHFLIKIVEVSPLSFDFWEDG